MAHTDKTPPGVIIIPKNANTKLTIEKPKFAIVSMAMGYTKVSLKGGGVVFGKEVEFDSLNWFEWDIKSDVLAAAGIKSGFKCGIVDKGRFSII